MSRLSIRQLRARGIRADRLTIYDGACAALSGPSGSGKTLLLRAIADLDENSGEIRLDDLSRDAIDGPGWRRRVMYVSAESHWWQPSVRPHAAQWNDDHLQALGFTPEVLDWEIQRLSSGERQRLALARALAHGPAALLLDEPSANLDQPNTNRVEQLVEDWRSATSGCVLWVSHDAEQRTRVASSDYVIHDGELSAADER